MVLKFVPVNVITPVSPLYLTLEIVAVGAVVSTTSASLSFKLLFVGRDVEDIAFP